MHPGSYPYITSLRFFASGWLCISCNNPLFYVLFLGFGIMFRKLFSHLFQKKFGCSSIQAPIRYMKARLSVFECKVPGRITKYKDGLTGDTISSLRCLYPSYYGFRPRSQRIPAFFTRTWHRDDLSGSQVQI